MILQTIALALLTPAAYQDFKEQAVDIRIILGVIVGSLITQLDLGYDLLGLIFALMIFAMLLVSQHFNFVGKADVLVVPAVIAINPFWDNVLVFAFGCTVPLAMAFLTKEKQPMLAYLGVAQFAVIALHALNAGRLI